MPSNIPTQIPSYVNDLGLANQQFARLQADVSGFERLATRLRTLTGINLPANPKNFSLMASRLAMLLRQIGLTTYEQYDRLLAGGEHAYVQEFIEALTTNTTHFFL